MALQHLVLHWFEEHQGTLFLPINFFCFLLLIIFFILWFIKRSLVGNHNVLLPPSPPKLPVIGNFHQLGTLPHRTLREMAKKYGPIMLLHLGSAPVLVVSSSEMAKEITKTHDSVFANRPASKGTRTFFYDGKDVGFTPYREYWREARKICVAEFFNAKKQVQSYNFVRQEEIRFLMEKITRSCALSPATVNLTELLLNNANNLVSRVSFGKTYDHDQDKDSGTNKLGHLMRDVMTLMGVFSAEDYFPWFGWIDTLTGLNGRMTKTFKAMDAFFEQAIEHHVSNNEHAAAAGHETLLDILLRAQKNKSLNITIARDNIKAIILDMFVAGTDTVSVIIEWAMVELMKNPESMKKAQEEVRRVVGNKSNVEEDDIHQMDYLKCIIKEILRLHPPAPLLIPRESSEDTKVAGFHIHAKTRVFINAWAIQRDPKYWTDPEEFIPERFMNNPIDHYKGHHFEYLPFGYGRRGCPGMQFGLTASEFLLANLLFWFDWELPDGLNKEDIDMTEAFGITVYKKNPTYLVPSLHFS